jgi:uncharacterized protein YijF (DUF1287 family)
MKRRVGAYFDRMLPLALSLISTLVTGLPDRGIYPELAGRVATEPPGSAQRPWLRVDATHRIVTLYDHRDALKAYPAAISPSLRTDRVSELGLHAGDPTRGDPTGEGVAMRAEDLAELRRFVAPESVVVMGAPGPREDRDGDGIVDALDILLGAKKLLFNGARYVERYVAIAYPGGDVPRHEGVCSDTVVRALRNAGIDLQKEIHEDIARAPEAYPMVEKVDASINHRRVRTLLPWFERHFVTLPRGERFLPGDVVFLDTFPRRAGPDHLGIVGDRPGPSGLPVVINNWTEGTVDAEMDLLSWVPVTHHFRAPSPHRPR